MKKEELLGIYSNEAGRIGFRRTEDEPYFIESQPDNFTRLIQAGFLDEKPVNLVIEETKIKPQDFEQRMQQEFREIVKVNNYNLAAAHFQQAVRIPQQIRKPEVLDDFILRVVERPVGGRIISMAEFAGGLDLSHIGIKELVLKTAQICYDTEQAMQTSDLGNSSMTALEFFQGRFQKWHEVRRERGEGICNPWTLVSSARDLLVVKFLRCIDFKDIKMSHGFNIFGNTDLIETNANEFYITDAKIEPKPYGFLVAAWLWNLALYSWRCRRWEFSKTLSYCAQIFYEVYGADVQLWLGHSIKCNLFERLYAALEIDLRYRRSPYNQLSDTEARTTIQNISYIINCMLPRLLPLNP